MAAAECINHLPDLLPDKDKLFNAIINFLGKMISPG